MNNPYIYTVPVQRKEGFFNRTSELTRIASRIAAERPQSVSIVGELRSGKTSLLRYLCDPEVQPEYLDDPGRYICLFLELEAQPPGTPHAFFARVNQALEALGEESMEASYDGFGDAVKKVMGEGRKLILFLDDFGLVTQNSGFPLDFFSFMRSLANSNDVGYVTTSGADLQKLCHTQDIEESPFFNIFTTVNLEPFKEAESRRLVEEPACLAGQAFGEEVEWILGLSGNAPYLLQLTANLAYAERQNGGGDRKGLSDRAFREARAYFEQMWDDRFSEAQKEVLHSVSQGKKVEKRHEYAAESLVRRGHLRQGEEGYAFRAELLARFVHEKGGGGFWRRLFG